MSYISAARVNEQVFVWEREDDGDRVLKRFNAPFECYYDDPDGDMRTIYDTPVSKQTFASSKDMFTFRKKVKELLAAGEPVKTYELLMPPEFKILQRHYSGKSSPKLNISSIDIEVDYDPKRGFSSVTNPYAPVNAVAVKHEWKDRTVCYAVPPPGFDKVKHAEELDNREYILVLCRDERELLLNFCKEIEDSDLLSAWNGDFFDFPYIAKRLEILFGEGRGEQYAGQGMQKMNFPLAPTPRFGERFVRGKPVQLLDMTGRITCDLMELFKKFEPAPRESYKLESIAEESLTDFNKLEYEGSLASLYRDDFIRFCDYNVRDTDILERLESKYKYIRLANELYHLSNGLFHQVKGTVKLADLAIYDYCVKQGTVTPDRYIDGDADDEGQIEGAIVLTPKPGMHKWFAFVDVGSLYPNAIITINISPETHWGQMINAESDFEKVIQQDGCMDEVHVNKTDGTHLSMPACQWKQYCLDNQLNISGFGTLYKNDKMGLIPSVLSSWKVLRKKNQKFMKETLTQLKTLLEESGVPHAQDPNKAFDTKEFLNIDPDIRKQAQLLLELSEKYDSYQYAYKIKLNSCYGALSNRFFSYYNKFHGESTTATGRTVLKHQCAYVNFLLTGEYSYKGDALLMGDTDSACFLTSTDNKADAIAVADEVAKMLNAEYSPFCQRTFLVPEASSHYIQATREIVCDSGIFIAKKHYMCHIVDKEGKSVDQMKIMGIETKKTSIPKKISKQLNEFLTRYVKGESWASVGKDILAYKKQVLSEDATDIINLGVPKNVNHLSDYTQQYKANNKTRLPQHVSGAILWNQCVTDLFPDPEAIKLSDGSKVKIFYLNKPFGRFKVICAPHDMTSLPNWLVDNFPIDRTRQVDRLVESPLEHVVECTGVRVPSLDDELAEGLFEWE